MKGEFDCAGCGLLVENPKVEGTVVIVGGSLHPKGARWLVHRVCLSCAEGYYATWAVAEIPRSTHG